MRMTEPKDWVADEQHRHLRPYLTAFKTICSTTVQINYFPKRTGFASSNLSCSRRWQWKSLAVMLFKKKPSRCWWSVVVGLTLPVVVLSTFLWKDDSRRWSWWCTQCTLSSICLLRQQDCEDDALMEGIIVTSLDRFRRNHREEEALQDLLNEKQSESCIQRRSCADFADNSQLVFA